MGSAREGFGPRLRAARERAGVTLDEIAESTKIKRSLLAGLERNDLSQWPKGIFRRAFLRDYLAAIGIASEALVAEFVRLFPDEGVGRGAEPLLERPSELRLTFADGPSTMRRALTRAAAASLDLALLAVPALLAAAARRPWSGVLAAAAVLYFTIATVALGRSPGMALLAGGLKRRGSRRSLAADVVAAREALHIVARGPAEPTRTEASPPAEEPRRSRRAASG